MRETPKVNTDRTVCVQSAGDEARHPTTTADATRPERGVGQAPSSDSRPDGRCETRAGVFRCDSATGHDGPCETVQEAAPWVGPALTPRQLRSAAGARAVCAERRTA